MTLTRDDLSVIEGDARISDKRIANQLGYAGKKHLHQIIKRHLDELSDYGQVFLHTEAKPLSKGVFRQTDAKPSSSKGGRPEVTYLLNEDQALLICMFARTAKAREARRHIIEVFKAWRRGDFYTLNSLY